LGILIPEDVPVIKCIGLNYMKHIQEGGRTPPLYSSIFLKARTSIASYGEDVPVPKLAQDDQCDYEGELSIVIGKTGKNIKEEEALDYVAGYVSSNDISLCKRQRDPAVSLPTMYNEGIIP
jgi:2-keto-4-pentenoate hydratase/2-oxohepta-3-ene-1,7-dioic acid hydratase in catechol pathway